MAASCVLRFSFFVFRSRSRLFAKGSLAAGASRSLSSSFFGMLGGGLFGQALGVYRVALHHFHGVSGAVESRKHGEAAVALRAVSFWTADSPWQVRHIIPSSLSTLS